MKKSLLISSPFQKICEAVPRVLSENNWAMRWQPDPMSGHFEGTQGPTMLTWASTIVIDITKVDEESSNVHVKCSAFFFGWGKCSSDVRKFYSGLEKLVGRRGGEPLLQPVHTVQRKVPALQTEGTEGSKHKFCRMCGAEILRDSLFCEECGSKVA